MKPTFAFFTLLTGVASLAISLPLNEHEIEGRHEHFPGTSDPPSVDATSTRSQWVSAYKPRKPVDDTAGGASVDATSTRSQWVSAYKPRKPVDDTAGGASLDATSTRSQWVTSYKPKKSAHHSNHWTCVFTSCPPAQATLT
ncbi:hypothetical protein B0T17DRAFT_504528 [Bombardia bombarda]|uniref:Uncharacterized protein n=1 Tax=Bombardia bombarda TaxID=252184 RepID=A0AA39XN86_9PEZI|nr:hypothetical protein B0T17DRAFT_504528 [Bombardia bombarda]